MAARACFCLILFFARGLAPDIAPGLFVWNVGQGQWITIVDNEGCWHFDAGGESAPWSRITKLCRARRNFLWLSHWDWDHVNFVGNLKRLLPEACLLGVPPGQTTARKRGLIERLPRCREAIPFTHWSPAPDPRRAANELSRIAIVRRTLIPGDSPSAQEKFWIRQLPDLARVRVLILGHHGSRTSTSKGLLDKITGARLAIACARFRRYGHPHAQVERLLRDRRIPLLRTEDWGTIQIEL